MLSSNPIDWGYTYSTPALHAVALDQGPSVLYSGSAVGYQGTDEALGTLYETGAAGEGAV